MAGDQSGKPDVNQIVLQLDGRIRRIERYLFDDDPPGDEDGPDDPNPGPRPPSLRELRTAVERLEKSVQMAATKEELEDVHRRLWEMVKEFAPVVQS